MAGAVADELRDPRTPPDVEIRSEAREPAPDPALGIPVALAPGGEPRHRLVAIGDSLTHGFQSGAVFRTDLSYPAIIAHTLGITGRFRHPTYPGHGGLPFNLEHVIRALEARHGSRLEWWRLPAAAVSLRREMDAIEDWWERGPGTDPGPATGIPHNLGIFGWDLRDVLSQTADGCRRQLGTPVDAALRQVVEHAGERAAIRVLHAARGPDGRALTPLGAARALGRDGGIETLVVMLGANNALQTVTRLDVTWSDDGYDDLEAKRRFTVWRPVHFARELEQVVAQVRAIDARHVLWATVPHVTIAPIARGVGGKGRPGSRYFPHYTRPWIADADFDPAQDPHVTAAQARAVDAAIDQYNTAITAAVAAARRDGRDWWLVELCGILDRLASRRYVQDPAARPDWWTPYPLPPELAALDPPPDTRMLLAGASGRAQGGIFSLDGVHPTTVAYGVIAQELVDVMARAGVAFPGRPGGAGHGPVRVDLARLVERDALIGDPPASVRPGLALLGWLDEQADVFARLLHRRP
ncbi:hypothetical protein FSW04_02430 [Baekduia soli]|uniref:SGNH/GDSL hydrolase family protein n=1 Tax=Baekduia soli TaxID=496014 RepID=A0A5B8U0J8_9ACTN|nr:hypothetical protein [Baekduia soli]QEC46544.1 hypothetical protein FSW04_02430 [Baekduia soli]